MKNYHPLFIVLTGGVAFALAFIAAGLSLSSIAPYIVVIGAALGAAAFASVTAMFPGWRASSLTRTLAFSVPAGFLAFLLHFTDLSVPLNVLMSFGHLGRLTRTAIHMLVPGIITGLLASRSLAGWSHLSRSAAA